jgi:hypothetical protein
MDKLDIMQEPAPSGFMTKLPQVVLSVLRIRRNPQPLFQFFFESRRDSASKIFKTEI